MASRYPPTLVLLIGLLLLVAPGCATIADSLTPFESGTSAPAAQVADQIPPVSANGPSGPDIPLVTAGLPESVHDPVPATPLSPDPSPGILAADPSPPAEPFDYDPFAREPGASAAPMEEYDPWEGYNTTMFEFNRKVDKYVLKPVAKVYDQVVPVVLQRGFSNFFHNVRFVPRLLNNLFQAKFKGAGIEGSRFLINSTLGVAGFFDPAKYWLSLETPDEDAGQTLGAYGVKPGPYVILPLLPPFTLRDVTGFVIDIFLDPINYLVFPSVELDGAPSLIAHKNRGTTTIAQFGSRVYEILNDRSLNLEKFQGVEEATLDLYVAVRNAYLQRRGKAIKE